MKRPDGAHMTSGEMEERIRELEGRLGNALAAITDLHSYEPDRVGECRACTVLHDNRSIWQQIVDGDIPGPERVVEESRDMKCDADSIVCEVDRGVFMSFGCSHKRNHAGPHSFEWVEIVTLLRNKHVYRKRKNFMELRERAAAELERLGRAAERQGTPFECDHDWITRREGYIQYCRKCPAMRNDPNRVPGTTDMTKELQKRLDRAVEPKVND